MHAAGVLLCAVAACTTVFTLSQHVRADLLYALNTERDNGNPERLTGRVDLWRTCMRYVSGHAILGYGYGAFWSSKEIEAISAEQGWPINEAHSAYLDLALMSGVPATALFLTLISFCFILSVCRFSRGDTLCFVWAMVMIFTLVASLTESILLPVNFSSYFILTVIWLCGTRPENGVALPRIASRFLRVYRNEQIIPAE
ncbi:MAG: O-antigen ligase family protein, partial [Nitrososphaerota archaeon]|nr:O-antigen ligase family protein [Nitrososphaerota archaeon]